MGLASAKDVGPRQPKEPGLRVSGGGELEVGLGLMALMLLNGQESKQSHRLHAHLTQRDCCSGADSVPGASVKPERQWSDLLPQRRHVEQRARRCRDVR